MRKPVAAGALAPWRASGGRFSRASIRDGARGAYDACH
jgi:hypothetical protein